MAKKKVKKKKGTVKKSSGAKSKTKKKKVKSKKASAAPKKKKVKIVHTLGGQEIGTQEGNLEDVEVTEAKGGDDEAQELDDIFDEDAENDEEI